MPRRNDFASNISKKYLTKFGSRSETNLLYSVLRVHENVTLTREEKRLCAEKVQSAAGADDDEDPPVPMPNTEVKLVCAEDTWMATSWKNR